VVDHDFQVPARCKVNQFIRLRSIAGEWLLNEDVLTILQRSFCQLVVRSDRGDHRDGVNLG
jgi:hypothetical protein